MDAVWEVLLPAVCTFGLALAVLWLFGRLLRPAPAGLTRVLIPGRGNGGALEQSVRAIIWLRGMGLLRCPIVIADVDLNPEGWELALRLTARWPDVIVWPVDDLPDYIARS